MWAVFKNKTSLWQKNNSYAGSVEWRGSQHPSLISVQAWRLASRTIKHHIHIVGENTTPAMSLCKIKLNVVKSKTISSGLELTQTDNMPSSLCTLHLSNITDSPFYTVPTSLLPIDGTRGTQQFSLRSISIYDKAHHRERDVKCLDSGG